MTTTATTTGVQCPVMGKRANGEGTVTKRKDGRWESRLSYIDPETGQPKRQAFYGRTAREVRDKMKEARGRIDDGRPPRDATTTVAAWLTHWRATTLAASDRKESTRDNYATLARKHLEPAPFGAIRLDRLRPSDVEALILAQRGKGFASSTIRSIYGVLRLALDGAVRDGLLARNPAAQVARPGVERKEANHLPRRHGCGCAAGR